MGETPIFTLFLSQCPRHLSCSILPLFFTLRMSSIYSFLISCLLRPASSVSLLQVLQLTPISSSSQLLVHFIFIALPLAHTHEVISVLYVMLTFPLHCEHLRTDMRAYSSFVPVTFLRTNEAAAGNLIFRERNGDLSYSLFLNHIFCSDLTKLICNSVDSKIL